MLPGAFRTNFYIKKLIMHKQSMVFCQSILSWGMEPIYLALTSMPKAGRIYQKNLQYQE